MMIPYDPNYFMWFPFIPPNCDKPPTVYSILNSIVNGGKLPEEYTKISNLAKEGRSTIFNFDYDLSEYLNKEDFETMILNHYMQRRIGFDTVTAFRLQLSVKINEIMPLYNKMFDMIYQTNNLGNVVKRYGFDNRVTESQNTTENSLQNNSKTNNISDRRYSELPQSELENLQNESYVTDHNYDVNTGEDQSTSTGNSISNTNGTDNNNYEENIITNNNIENYLKVSQETKHIYSLIFKDLDCLFYQLL